MHDIRKPYTHSRSNNAHGRDVRLKVEQFEKRAYGDEEDPDMYSRGEISIPIHVDQRKPRDIQSRDVYPKRGGDGIGFRNERASFGGGGEGSNRTSIIFATVTLAVVLVVFLLTYVFNQATVTVNPKYVDVDSISKSFTFSTEEKPGFVLYTLGTTTITKSKKLAVSESKLLETKASGKIIIFNKFDNSPQKLIKNTRFESSSGKIYRINESITVPGMKGETPGSIEVTVYADSTGSDYNSDPTDFTIPGFKGSPRFQGFFARSNGPIAGGAQGNVSLVSKSDLDAAKDELALELTKAIKTTFKDMKKEGYTGMYDAAKIVFVDNEKNVAVGETSTYTVTATGYIPFAESASLAHAVATTLREYGTNDPVRLDYANTLSFTVKDQASLGSGEDTEVLLEGSPRVVWVTDKAAVTKSLLGKDKSDFTEIMSSVTSVDKATNSFFPLWLTKFPAKASHITIEEQLKQR